MKKFAIALLMLAALASCEEDLPTPSTNEGTTENPVPPPDGG